MAASLREKGERFRALHEGPAFFIPNPWDVGSAKVLAALGFPALATTSSGFAFTLGKPDGGTSLDEVVAHTAALAAGTDVPLAVDLENGHGDDLHQAVERVAAAVAQARALDVPFVLTARTENQLRGSRDLDETIIRLRAFERAGADVLFAPGLRTADEVRRVCEAVSRPVNVLVHAGLRRDEVVAAGAQRMSVGGALTWTAVEAMAAAARAMLEDGDLSALRGGGQVAEWRAAG
jgi:2-methylisocitrate lyase-like PEP mutase family enzyme